MRIILSEEQINNITTHNVNEAYQNAETKKLNSGSSINPNMIINNKEIGLKILKGLQSEFGFSINQLIGIGASIYQECRFDPNAENSKSTAYGIGQWVTRYGDSLSRQFFMCDYLNTNYGTKYYCRSLGGKMPQPIPLRYQILWMIT